MIQCIACTLFSFRDAGKMAALGFGPCGKSHDKHHYKSASYRRECGAFTQVSADVEAARREWLGKK